MNNTNDDTDTSTESAFIRRKFTITESLDNELQGLANRHYRGNVSLCLRAAIEDHIQTLEGEGDITTRRLIAQIDEVGQRQQVLLEKIATLATEDEARESVSPSGEQNMPDWPLPPDDREVFSAISSATDNLHVDDLMETVALPKIRVMQALGALVDSGYVFRTDPHNHRYQVPGTAATSNEGFR